MKYAFVRFHVITVVAALLVSAPAVTKKAH
jgi:hypothetical protein